MTKISLPTLLRRTVRSETKQKTLQLWNCGWRTTQKRANSSSIQLASCSSETCSGTDFRVLMERLSEGWWHGEGETHRSISAPLTSHLLRPKPSCHAKTQNFARQWPSALLIECFFLRREILLSLEKCYRTLRLQPLSTVQDCTECPFHQRISPLRILVNNIDRKGTDRVMSRSLVNAIMNLRVP